MNEEAETAANNAISFECKKDGLAQRQSGDWQLRFTVSAIDMDQRLAACPMGTRFACVLVEVNDDESPVDHKAMDRDKWRDLGPAKQAGMRCKEPMFWAFLNEELHFAGVTSEQRAAEAVRTHCGVGSRGELMLPGNQRPRELWYGLDLGYQAWKVRENG
jgi:hypothetical protein